VAGTGVNIITGKLERSGTAVARRRENKNAGREETLEKRKAILAALTRATGDTAPDGILDCPNSNDDYYTLSAEEIHALISGDMEKIESWVNNLDRQHATWLLRQLIRENW
jgi:hypothetical protein